MSENVSFATTFNLSRHPISGYVPRKRLGAGAAILDEPSDLQNKVLDTVESFSD